MSESNLTPSQRRLTSILAQAWFPPKPEVVARVRSGIASGELLRDRRALLREIQSDLSLFLHGVRELSKRATSAAPLPAEQLVPELLLSRASDDELDEIFNVLPDSFSSVPYHAAGEGASARTTQAMVAAIATELLDQAQARPANLGFSCAVFRQLGLLLIAWNHPHVYSRMTSRLEPDESLDEALARVLGISPSTLGLALAREWRICPIIRASMGDEVPEETSLVREVGVRMRMLCEVGEQLAQIAGKDPAPQAMNDYQEACSFILERLGPDGMARIFAQVEAVCRNVREQFPSLCGDLSMEKGSRSGEVPAAFDRKAYAGKIPRFLEDHFAFMYERFAKGASAEELRSVLDQAIRSLGFSRAIVYLLDPVQAVLHPRVALGDQDLVSARGVAIGSPEGVGAQMMARAFGSEDLILNGKATRQLSVRIGAPQPFGVLTLEIPREAYDSRSELLGNCIRALADVIGELVRR